MPHICFAFAALRTPQTRCVAPLEQGADAFPFRADARLSVYIAPLEMPLFATAANKPKPIILGVRFSWGR